MTYDARRPWTSVPPPPARGPVPAASKGRPNQIRPQRQGGAWLNPIVPEPSALYTPSATQGLLPRDDGHDPITTRAPPATYFNRGQHASNGGTINNYGSETKNYYHQQRMHGSLKELYNHCSPYAAFNSKERFDPPRCTPATRLAIIRRLEEWFNNAKYDPVSLSPWPSQVFWLYGGAGVGKSSLAQSISEKFHENGKLAASFFFFRNDPSRSNGDHLIPSLVSDFVKTFEGMGPLVEEKIHTNPDLFDKTYELQFLELLIEPLQRLSISDFDGSQSAAALECRPRVIVIDGLDECQNTDIQRELLRVIARSIPHIPYPLRFFVTSRPESHLTDAFDRDLQDVSVFRYNLSDDPDADADIRRYLEDNFQEICRSHRFRESLPPHWPHPDLVGLLVERSSGHFIYASTVVKYVQSHKHRPHERLQRILGFSAPARDKPYARLDELYRFIFDGVDPDQLLNIQAVLGVLYLKSQRTGFFEREHSSSNHRTIEDLLEMKWDHILELFDPLLSLVAVDADLRIFHKSLFDYLIDITRSGDQHLNLVPAHEAAATFVVTRCLLNPTCIPTHLDFRNFAYHAQFTTKPNGPLEQYLTQYSQDVLHHHRFLHSNVEEHPDVFFVSSLAYALRTLSYQRSDSATQCLRRYSSLLRQKSLPGGQIKSDQYFNIQRHNGNSTKSELDSLLKDWSPIGFVPVKVDQADLRKKFAIIQQEQAIFSAYAEACLYVHEVTAFSLVHGQHFVHAYHTIWYKPLLKPAFFMLFTYPTSNNAVSCSIFGRREMENGDDNAIFTKARKHLNQAGKELGYPELPESPL